MRYLVPIILFFNLGLATAQVITIAQDAYDTGNRIVTFQMVDATDGYTAETGLSVTCTIKEPTASSYSSCANSVSEIGTGTYQYILSPAEVEDTGALSLYFTATGARPRQIDVDVLSGGGSYVLGTGLVTSPSNIANSYWTKTASSATADTTADYNSQTIADTLTGNGSSGTHQAQKILVKPQGSGFYLFTTEVKSGTINNAWVGDAGWGAGIDLNTSTGAISPSSVGYLRGWLVNKLASGWYRVYLVVVPTPTDTTGLYPTVALGNGTGGTGVQTFSSSGTMVFARTQYYRLEDVNPELVKLVRPWLQSGTSSSQVTLALNETTSNDVFKDREVCFVLNASTAYAYSHEYCSCVTAYTGSTKVLDMRPVAVTLSSSYQYYFRGNCTYNVNVTSVSANAINASAIASDAIDNDALADNTIGANTIADDAIDAGAIASNAITSSEFAQSSADKVWNTDPTTCSTSNTALCYLEKAKKYVANKLSIVGSNYTLYEDDQVTSYETGTTNSSGRDPN